MIRLENKKGDWNKTSNFLENVSKAINSLDLNKYGQQGVDALAVATSKDTGKTAKSWYYEIINDKGSKELHFCNSNIQNGYNVAILLEYGHLTRSGVYVKGLHYVDDTLYPIFKNIAEEIWKEVTNA